MIDRHDRQVFTRHFCNIASPQTGTDDDVVGRDITTAGFHTDDAAVLNVESGRGGVGPGLRLTGLYGLVDEYACYGL